MMDLDDTLSPARHFVMNETVHLAVIFIAFVGAQAALIVGAVPAIAGSAGLGLLAGFAFWGWMTVKNPPTQYDKVVESEIIPYDQWPNECYVCGDEIPDDMEYRGQFVIHKGESEAKTKAAPLCESCTWTYSTLMDNHEALVGAYDRRGNPVDL